jgi:circadian clock protein KaiC
MPFGVQGLDAITCGGLPKGRPTLVCGGVGTGKTLLAMEFIIHGARQLDEPGVFMTFEETTKDLIQNVASLGFDLKDLTARKKLVLDSVYIHRSELKEAGEYDLEGLFIRLGHAIDSIGAKRVVLDGVDSLFAGLPNPFILRAELRRLFRWLKDKGVTAIITGESGQETLTRQGLEEYVSDCVIFLTHTVNRQVASRRLRVIKYRGSTHNMSEYPFQIGPDGFSMFPVVSHFLRHTATTHRISSGIADLDQMLGGSGYHRGSTVLISGAAGTGKSSLAAQFVDGACGRGERVAYFSFEESSDQIMRNMQSIGIDLGRWVKKGLLEFRSSRPTFVNLELNLIGMHKMIDTFKPQVVIVDPLNAFSTTTDNTELTLMLVRLVDFLKSHKISSMFTSLTAGNHGSDQSEVAISSLIDTWLLVKGIETVGERNRGLYILKSRGMPHSNQVREFRLTNRGVVLSELYVGPGGVLTGSMRLAQEALEKAEKLSREQETEGRELALKRKREALESQIKALRSEFEAQEAETMHLVRQEKRQEAQLAIERLEMTAVRSGKSLSTEEGASKGASKGASV